MSKILVLCVVLSVFSVGCKENSQSNLEINQSGKVQDIAKNDNFSIDKNASQAPEILIKTYDGPFGLAMGIGVDELLGEVASGIISKSDPNTYIIRPPKLVPGFDRYYAVATKEDGVCKIIAISEVNVVNKAGDQLKSRVDEIAEMVRLKYGKSRKKYDFARQDVYRRNPDFFMMALREEAVIYGFDWVAQANNAMLTNDIEEINIFANASEMSAGWVSLEYIFKNFKSCQANIKKAKSTNL